MQMTTWRAEISSAMVRNNDDWSKVEGVRIKDVKYLDQEFDSDWGSAQGQPFFLWTKNFVYFAQEFDGSEWAGSVPRNPGQGSQPAHL